MRYNNEDKNNNYNVVILGYRIALDATFGSEFVKPLELFIKANVRCQVIVLSSLGEFARKNLRKRWQRREESFPEITRGHIHRLPILPSRFDQLFEPYWLLAKALNYYRDKSSTLIVHAVGTRAGLLATRVRDRYPGLGIKVMFRVTGPVAEEYIYRHKNAQVHAEMRRTYTKLNEHENEVYKNADSIVCLSEEMVKYAAKRTASVTRIVNIGCFADTKEFLPNNDDREATRRQLGIEESFVVVHSGSLHPWQRPEEVIKLFSRIVCIEPKSHFLVLTSDGGVLKRIMHEQDCEERRITILSVEHSAVPKYLRASDVAILGRGLFEEPQLINLLSSPIKISEYLAAGCPVIMGENIGDFSRIVDENDLGLVLSNKTDNSSLEKALRAFISRIKNDQSKVRSHCSKFAESRLDMSKSARAYQEVYRRMIYAPDCSIV